MTLKRILIHEFKSLSFKTSFENIKIIVYNCLEFEIGKSYRPYIGPILGTVTIHIPIPVDSVCRPN